MSAHASPAGNLNVLALVSAIDPRVAAAIALMEQRLREPLTVTGIADAVRVPPARLVHLFRKETGVAPLVYLREVRLERARTLLQRSSLSMDEVVAVTGFRSAFDFARAFERRFGTTPDAVRRCDSLPQWTRRRAHPLLRLVRNDRRSDE